MLNQEIDGFIQDVLKQESKTKLVQLLEGYRLCARAEGKSQNYISLVTYSVKFLTLFLREKGFSTNVLEINAQHIRGFILHLQSVSRFASHHFTKPQDIKLSGHAINAYLRSLRAFWSWLETEGLILNNPFSRVKIPKAPKKIIPTLSDEQIKALLAQVDTISSEGFRNYSIIILLLDTGIRVSEPTACRIDELNLESRCLKVNGKGSKERVVPFGKTAQKALWRYITVHRPEPQIPRLNNLFLTFDGRPMTKNWLFLRLCG